MKRILIILSVLLFIVCCAGKGEPVNYEAKDDYHLQLIFTVDNVKIYRFSDAGYYHYLAIGTGKILNIKQSKIINTGKSQTVEHWDDSTIDKE
jgi:hypothetical protein